MYYIGVDLGTSSVKLLLMEENGEVKKTVTRAYDCQFPHPGWSEQDPKVWYEESMQGLKELTEGLDKSQVRGIGVGGQMHGLVTLDAQDRVLRPAILWNDGRTEKQTRYLNEEIGQERLAELTANIAFAGFTAPKILWMKENEPELFARIEKIMLPKDYLTYRLSGEFCTDYSDAAGMLLLDVEHKCYSKEMCEICGITEAMLPRLCESYEKVGTLRPEIAGELGFSEDVLLAAGAGDNAAAAVAMGVVEEGECNISLGTSGTVFIPTKHCITKSNHAIHSFAASDGSFHLLGCILAAASSNQWWAEKILETTDYQKEQADIQKLGENHVFYLPYLMGERSPHNDPFARGAFLGMSMDTTRADMMQAVLEGVAFALCDCVEIAREQGITLTTSCICGGGAKSLLWRRIVANVCNLKLEIMEHEEGPSMGGAILAAVADGVYPDVKSACKAIVKVTETVEPEPELVEKYRGKYEVYKQLYPALRPVYPKLA